MAVASWMSFLPSSVHSIFDTGGRTIHLRVNHSIVKLIMCEFDSSIGYMKIYEFNFYIFIHFSRNTLSSYMTV